MHIPINKQNSIYPAGSKRLCSVPSSGSQNRVPCSLPWTPLPDSVADWGAHSLHAQQTHTRAFVSLFLPLVKVCAPPFVALFSLNFLEVLSWKHPQSISHCPSCLTMGTNSYFPGKLILLRVSRWLYWLCWLWKLQPRRSLKTKKNTTKRFCG